MNKKELKKISLQFRTLASQMLKVNSQEEIYCIQQFYDFIVNTPYIFDYIQNCKGEDIDFKTVFSEMVYGEVLLLPSKKEQLVCFEFQLLKYILDNPSQLRSICFGYSNSRKISDNIEAFMRKSIEPFVVELRTYLELGYIDVEEKNDIDLDDSVEKRIFLSYCQKDSDIADFIDEEISSKISGKAKISRDIRDVKYHESFKRFMESIEKHDYVIMIISDNYLKSRNCMYEMLEVVKDRRFDEKLLFIIISDDDIIYYKVAPNYPIGADVYSNDGVFKYTQYWDREASDLQNKIKEFDDSTCAISFIKEKTLVKKILLDLPCLLEFIRDTKGLPLKEHVNNGFSEMLLFMKL